jgi:4-amino-4-deoxy-L-arabinose transferase-like glycosyltransferase
MIHKIFTTIRYFANSPLFWIFISSFFARLSYGFFINTNTSVSTYVDDLDYISYANNILSQGIWVPDISKLYSNSHLVAPGYPMVVAFLFYLFGQSYTVIILFNSLISSISVVVIFFIGKETFNKQVGLMSSAFATFYVMFYISIPRFLKEDLILLLLVLAVYFFIRESKRSYVSYFLPLFSLIYGMLIHVDERYFSYLLVFVIGFIFLNKGGNIKRGIKRSLIFIVLVSILMTPWLIRNYVVYGDRVVVITEQTARFTDKIFDYNPLLSDYGKKEEKYSRFEWEDSFADNLRANEDIPELKRGKRYRSLQQGVRDGNMPHKFSTTEALVNNFIEHWRPFRLSSGYIGSGYRYSKPWSNLHNITSVLTYGILLPFFVVGSVLVFRRRDKYGILILSLIFVNTLLHVLLFAGKERYRVPVDSFIIIISCKVMYDIILSCRNYKYVKKIDKFIKKFSDNCS